MEYWKVVWHHQYDEEPVTIWSEIGDDGYETRKVEEHRDGSRTWADENRSTGRTGLGEIPVGPIEDVQSQPEFAARVIGAGEFEKIWHEVRAGDQ